jgi:hypothetical protein
VVNDAVVDDEDDGGGEVGELTGVDAATPVRLFRTDAGIWLS